MKHFREMRSATGRRIDRMIHGMADLDSLDELEQRFLAESGDVLPADCFCWNNWTRDLSAPIAFKANTGYNEPAEDLMPIFVEVVGHHPVIATNQLPMSAKQVLRLSDFQTYASFKDNPLFREVYRHLDSHFQLAYTPCVLEDRSIVLTWNRRALDFNEGDRQILHYMGDRLAIISRMIEERQKLAATWQELCGFLNIRMPEMPVKSLGVAGTRLLSELMKGRSRLEIAKTRGVRRDSLDKQLGAIRERLGLENHQQLLSAFAELRK